MNQTDTDPTRPAAPPEPSEIIIISGFLGSGKTTLLKRFLDWEFARGIQPLVIMSEFGDFDVDGAIIADERLKIIAITGGCVCCTNKDELAGAISKMTREAPGSHIYIETTGLADPAGVLATITPLLQPETAMIKKVLVVYDADRHGKFDRDETMVEKQVLTADWILINKCDLVAEGLTPIISDLSETNPAATILPTIHCDIDIEESVKGATGCFASNRVAEATNETYKSFAFQFDTRLYRAPFEKWLASLPRNVIRLKGFVRFEEESGIFEIQATRGRYDITLFPTVRWMDSTLVAITHPMPADDLLAGLRKCVPPSGRRRIVDC